MKEQKLEQNWKMTLKQSSEEPGELVRGLLGKTFTTSVPASLIGTLYEAGEIGDPYYRTNELTVLPLSNEDCEWENEFTVDGEMLESDFLALRFSGIDTLADIFINGELVLSVDNMHRTYELELHGLVHEGTNRVLVHIFSPVRFIKEENAKVYCGGVGDSMEGYPHLRKAHCMFGWDWGPRIPDMGLWRPVSVIWGRKARLDDVRITQTHTENAVLLDPEVTLDLFDNGTCTCGNADLELQVEVTCEGPDGECYEADPDSGTITVTEPKKWMPHGYGEQPLYTIRTVLTDGAGEALDERIFRIGLRTMTVNRDPNPWGENFCHEINGLKIFAMGADYIPEDCILSRTNEERTRRLLSDAVLSNHNCIRVWGGGYYPEDWFYDICDELGLVVWQDFMFACANYELTEHFEENITEEIIGQIKRLRHHASLGLWCGNNEMETQTLDRCWKPSQKQFIDYCKIFDYIIPKLVKEYDPQAFYWPSSPSSGGNYDNPWDEARGDTHYWDVWHGEKPFTEYRKHHFAYLSEFGFQAFPGLETVKSFTEPGDRNVFSRVMEMHQRNRMANGKILKYLSDTYRYPKDFDHLLYASGMLQEEAIRYGVEHFRRHRGRSMGTVVWQLNDNWPVASWAGIDYFGRWKPLQYGEKRFFAPVLVSCEEEGELSSRPSCVAEPEVIEISAKLHVANETGKCISGEVRWSLRNMLGEILEGDTEELTVPAYDGAWLPKLDFSEYDPLSVYLSYEFAAEGEVLSSGTTIFAAPKHMNFTDPGLTAELSGTAVTVKAEHYAKNVELITDDPDVLLSDNYFDMNPGTVTVRVLRGTPTSVRVRSIYDIG